jgi:pyrroloquinoline quinone biosynthesis protein B
MVLNCSPDIREQIGAITLLQPDRLRGSPIAAVVLTNGDLDHIGGLLSLREGTAFQLYGTSAVLQTLTDNPVFSVLNSGPVSRHVFAPGLPFSPLEGLRVEAFTVPGKLPLYMEGSSPDTELESEYTVGLEVSDDQGGRLHYIPGCSKLTPALRNRLSNSSCVFFDGTLWRDDEMIREGIGTKTGRRMGHMPVSGDDGTIVAFKSLPVKRKVLIHINNSNPILVAGSAERRAAEDAGWTIAEDGMEIET